MGRDETKMTSQPYRLAVYHNQRAGGARRVVHGQIKQLHARGYQIDLFSLSMAQSDFMPLSPYAEHEFVFNYDMPALFKQRIPFITPYLHAYQIITGLRRMESVLKEIASMIDQREYNAVLVHDCPYSFIPPILKYLHTPSLLYVHSMPYRLYDPDSPTHSLIERIKANYYYLARRYVADYRHRLESENLKAASLVLANSFFTKELLYQRYGVMGRTLHPGVDVELFHPLGKGYHDSVLSVGSLHWMKGHRLVIEAVAQIPESIRPRVLIATTDANDAEATLLQALASNGGVNLEITQIQDDARLVEVYNQAVCVVCGFFVEPFGLVPLEAMACGTPVVAVCEGGLRESVIDGVNGLLVERDIDDFSEAIQRLIVDPQLRRELGTKGAEIVRERWSWYYVNNKLERFLQIVI